MSIISRLSRALSAHSSGRISDLELHGVTIGAIDEFVTDRLAEQAASKAEADFAALAGVNDPGPAGLSSDGGNSVTTVTISAAELARMQEMAAFGARPDVIEAVARAKANPVRTPTEAEWQAQHRRHAPAPAMLSAEAAGEYSEAQWDDFTHSMGMGGRPMPRGLYVVDPREPGGVPRSTSHLSGISEADWDGYVEGLGMGSDPYGKYRKRRR